MKDYYEILGVTKDASQEDIKKAYRKLAHQHHPDKGGGDEAAFKQVNEAYQILGNPEKRAQYDQFGHQAFSGPGGPPPGWDFSGFGSGGVNIDLEDLFEGVFGGRQARVRKGRDIVVDVSVSLEEAFRGTVKEIELRKFTQCKHCQGEGAEPGTVKKTCENCGGKGEIKQARQILFGVFSQSSTCPTCLGEGEYPERPCHECGGDGRVRAIEKLSIPIPAGIDSDNLIRIGKKGEYGPRGAEPGDLIARITVLSHKDLERVGENLHSKVKISFPQAVFGDTIRVLTIEGETDLRVPEGIQSGTELRLSGRGMPNGHGSRGDQYIKIDVATPKKLSRKAKKLMEELKEELK